MNKILRTLLILALLTLWVWLTPSFYQKGGFQDEGRWVIISILIFLAVDELLVYGKGHWLESAIVTFTFTAISLFLTVFVVGTAVVEARWGDRTWHLWENENRIFMNAVMVVSNSVIFLLLVAGYRAFLRDGLRAFVKEKVLKPKS